MIFDGQRWTRARAVVALPREYWIGKQKNYATFGRLCRSDANGAIKTEYVFRGYFPFRLRKPGEMPDPDGVKDGEEFWFAWAKPIPFTGHSLTNMMYAKDGSACLLKNGVVYVRGKKPK